MDTSPTAKVILVVGPEEERWATLFMKRFHSPLKTARTPSGLVVESWDAHRLASRPPWLGQPDVLVALLLLVTDSLAAFWTNQTAFATIPRNVIRFRVLCEPLTKPWSDPGAESLGPPDQPLTLIPGKDLKNVLDRIVATVTERLTSSPNVQSEARGAEVGTHRPDEEARSTEPGQPTTQPLTRLSEFQTAESIQFLFRRATEIATGRSPPNAITTSFMLFAISESVDTDGPWTPHFLRESLNRLSPNYEHVRDSYLSSMGVRMPRGRAKGTARGEVPVAMSARMFATLERASEYAVRTTGRRVIHARHLLAALMTSRRAPFDSGALLTMKELGVDPGDLRLALYDWVRGYGDSDAVWAEILIGAMPVVRRLGGFCADRPSTTEDLLGIETEVQALAALIAARTVSPPLSIGLFGEWGSGKTFFMRALRSAIDGLSAEARGASLMQRDLPFYKNIAQIEFNAWHYVEGNLWASLVEHILDNLYKKKDPLVTRQLQEGLIRKLAEETALTQATSNAVVTAQAATQSAQEELETAQRKLDDKTKEVAQLNAASVRKDFLLTGAAAPVAAVLEELGMGQVSSSAAELESALRQIHGVLGRGERFLTPLLRGRHRGRRFVWLALSLLGAPAVAVLVNYLMGAAPGTEIYAYASGLATLISAVVPWLKHQADWMSKRLDQAEAAQRAFDAEMAKATANHVAQVTAAEQKLRELTSTFEAAQQKHADAKGREAAAAADLEAATTGRLLANFITDRAASSDYRKHLGVLALVRDDFEKLSGLIEEENWRLSPDDPAEKTRSDGLKRFATLAEEDVDMERRINRIVLYIDDLDRCPPNKVVDVLQAVHLLLAFPLFVVVVGVDARWVTKSLETRYRELLRIDSKFTSEDEKLLLGAATPNDYLEKIFQIPYWLKPMDLRASQNMMGGLVKGSLAKSTDADSAQSSAHGGPIGGPGPTTPPGTSQADTSFQSAPANPPPISPPPEGAGPPSGVDSQNASTGSPPVLDLTITEDELEYMRKLAGLLGRSPRALKRFVNVYRLIKAGLTEHELQAFTRTRLPLGDYQAVLFLLAVDTGAPLAARLFFETVESSQEPVSVEWLIREMNKKATPQNSADWTRLRLWLTSQREVIPKETDLSILEAWTTRVGRYSFEVGRA